MVHLSPWGDYLCEDMRAGLVDDGVECVLDVQVQGLDSGNGGVRPVAVVDNSVAFAEVQEGLDVGGAAAGNGDDRVDVAGAEELDREGAHGCAAAVDDEGGRGGGCAGWGPRGGEGVVVVQGDYGR